MIADRFLSWEVARPGEATRLRHEIVAYVEEVGAHEPVVERVRLALSEALTNVVVHAYLERDPGPLSAQAWCNPDHLFVRVCDERRRPLTRTDSPGLRVGIALMGSTADNVRIAGRPDALGTVVSLRFGLHGRSGAV